MLSRSYEKKLYKKLTEAVDHAREYQGCKVAVPQLQILNNIYFR